uniref:Protein kinase putative n=1 Tax=Albugo laibachii Nc14 TaxID=890382 RepID=F0WKE7_9STRA|nr:protein kinase putative [Albugo laibachii Nc14]|eukprot:CCA21751.1 protein kinase putative [Albugo laibachii Nc14]
MRWSLLCHCKRRTLNDKYELMDKIGDGKTGSVYAASKRDGNGGKFAVKLVSFDYLSSQNRRQALDSEIKILSQLTHRSIIGFVDVFEEKDAYAIVTERAEGELLSVLARYHAFQICERDIAFLIHDLLEAVSYLHHMGVTHRDIKLENIMCKSRNLHDGIVLIDFGLAHRYSKGSERPQGMNGTCHYMAPEMFGRESVYDHRIDIWAIGVVAFILLSGCYPFDAKFMSQVEDQIVLGSFAFPKDIVDSISDDAKDFISQILVPDPNLRASAATYLQHPWVQHWQKQSTNVYLTERLKQFGEQKMKL